MEAGVSDRLVLFGQSAAFSGPAQELGRNMGRGIEAAFHEVNEAGGVHGRRLDLVSLDDAYEPEAAIANTLELIEQESIFALIGLLARPPRAPRSRWPRPSGSLHCALHRRSPFCEMPSGKP